MNNFYGLRAQGRHSPYVGRDLTNQELLNGFTENIQYVGQNHTSGGISAFSLDYPFRSVRIGQVSYKPNLTLNDFVDQLLQKVILEVSIIQLLIKFMLHPKPKIYPCGDP